MEASNRPRGGWGGDRFGWTQTNTKKENIDKTI